MRFHIYRYSKYNTESFWLENPEEVPEETVQPVEHEEYLDDYGVFLETPINEDNIQSYENVKQNILLARECCNWAATYDVEASLSNESSLTEVKAILADVIESNPNIKRKFERVESTETEEQQKKRIVVVETPTRTESLKNIFEDYAESLKNSYEYRVKYEMDEEKEKPHYFIVWLNENNQVEINEKINFNLNDKNENYRLIISNQDYFDFIIDDTSMQRFRKHPPYEGVNNMEMLERDKLDNGNYDDQCAYLLQLKDIGRIISLSSKFILQPNEENLITVNCYDIGSITESIDNCPELDEFPEIKNGNFESIYDLTPKQRDKINNILCFENDCERRANMEYDKFSTGYTWID